MKVFVFSDNIAHLTLNDIKTPEFRYGFFQRLFFCPIIFCRDTEHNSSCGINSLFQFAAPNVIILLL